MWLGMYVVASPWGVVGCQECPTTQAPLRVSKLSEVVSYTQAPGLAACPGQTSSCRKGAISSKGVTRTRGPTAESEGRDGGHAGVGCPHMGPTALCCTAKDFMTILSHLVHFTNKGNGTKSHLT